MPAATKNPTLKIVGYASYPLDDLVEFERNPRRGNVPKIAESVFINGQFQTVVVWHTQKGKVRKVKGKQSILAGNHTWKAIVWLDQIARGLADKPEWLTRLEKKYKRQIAPFPTIEVTQVEAANDEEARRIVIAANKIPDMGGYDIDELKDMLASLPDAYGTGFTEEEHDLVLRAAQSAQDAALSAMVDMDEKNDDDALGAILARAAAPSSPLDEGVQRLDEFQAVEAEVPEAEVDNFQSQLAEIQGILQLKDDLSFPGAPGDFWQIPMLDSKMLMETLPEKFDTWGGKDATPDDGETWWLWNYGAAGASGLPLDRAVLCFYTYDTKFEEWWYTPSFYVAKALNGGVRYAVCPDFSFYDTLTRTEILFGVHRSQWLGRYFQEAGMRVAPRLQFSLSDPETLQFNLLGIPKKAPIIFTSQQNMADEAAEVKSYETILSQLKLLQCGTLVVYGGNPARRVAERLAKAQKTTEIKHLMNVAGKRRDVVYGKKEGLAATKGLKKLNRNRNRDVGGDDVDE